jgi:hypothetical protein
MGQNNQFTQDIHSQAARRISSLAGFSRLSLAPGFSRGVRMMARSADRGGLQAAPVRRQAKLLPLLIHSSIAACAQPSS